MKTQRTLRRLSALAGLFLTLGAAGLRAQSPATVGITSIGHSNYSMLRVTSNISDDGGAAILERGIVYSETALNNAPTLGGASVLSAVSTETTNSYFSYALGVKAATGYTFRAYVTNAAGTAYSSNFPITTGAPSVLFTGFSTDGIHSVDLGDTDNAINVIVQSDGKPVLLINRTDAGRATLMRRNTNANVDLTFSTDGRADLSVPDSTADTLAGVTLQNDGKIVVTGYSTFADGSNRIVVARFLTDGTQDPDFDGDGVAVINAANLEYGLSGADAQAFAADVTVQTDGKIVVAGFLRYEAGGKDNGLVLRLNADGSLDSTFGGNGVVGVDAGSTIRTLFSAVEMQPDDKIVLGGSRVVSGFDFQCVAARLTPAGALDAGFGTGGLVMFDANLEEGGSFNEMDQVNDLKLAPDGGILLAIQSDTASFTPIYFVARLNRSNGALDSSFGGNGIINTDMAGTVIRMDVQGDGRILLAGGDAGFNTTVLRLLPTGAFDPDWGTDGILVNTAAASATGVCVGRNGFIFVSALDKALSGGDAFIFNFRGDGVMAMPALSPADNATGVGVNDNLTLFFGVGGVPHTGNIEIIHARTFAVMESIPVTDPRVTGTDTITINPDATLAPGTKYYVRVPFHAFNTYPNINPSPGISNTMWEFTTAGEPPLAVVSDNNSHAGVTGFAATLTLTDFTVPANDDRLLIASTVNSANQPAPALTYNGLPMTLVATENTTSGLRTSLYALLMGSSASATTADIVATGASITNLGAVSFHNVNQTTPYTEAVDTDYPFDGDTFSTLTVPSHSGNDLVLDAIGMFANGATGISAAAGQTQEVQNSSPIPVHLGISTKPATGADVDMTWDFQTSTSIGIGSLAHLGINILSVLSSLSEPEIAISGNSVDIDNGDDTPDAADHTDFGSVSLGGSLARTFTITNSGDAALNLTGTAPDYVTLSGAGAAHFAVTTQPATPVTASGGTTTFVITYTPGGTGAQTATVSIASDDADEAPFTFDVSGSGLPALLGDHPSNPAGSASEILVNRPGAPTGLYWIDPDNAGPLGAFQVYCDMTTDGGGWMLGVNSLNGSTSGSTDVDANRGTAGLNLGHTRQLALLVGSQPVDIRHDIVKGGIRFHAKYAAPAPYYGTLPMNWTPLPGYTGGSEATLGLNYHFNRPWSTVDNDQDGISGNCAQLFGVPWYHNACWQVIPVQTTSSGYPMDAPVSLPVPDGPRLDRYSIWFRADSLPPFAPEIAVSGNSVDIDNGDDTPDTADHTDFGGTPLGTPVARTFTITNSGAAVLNLTGTAPDYVTLSGTGATHFSVTTQPAAATVAASGGTRTFVITYDPSAVGTHSATVSIANDDGDENPFTFDITGTGAAVAPTVTTATQSGVTHNSATLGGEVTADGGASVTDRGIVWGTSADPTTGDNKVQIGSGTGVFSQLVTGLPSSTTVHARAYAINSAGTAYGGNISFATSATPVAVISLNRANANPSRANTVNWTLTFASTVTGVTASNFSLSGAAAAGASVGTPATGNGGLSWTVPVTTGGTDGALTLSLANATGLSAPVSTALPYAGESYTMDKTPPQVTINQAAGQADPASAGPVNFTVVFSEDVSGFDSPADVALSGTAGADSVSITGGPMTYNVAVSGMTSDGTVVAVVNAGAAQDAAGNLSAGSTSTDNTVTFLTPETPGLVVTTAADTVDAFDNLTSLREAVAYANTLSGPQTITFDAGVFAGGGTITLTQQLVPTGSVTLDGDIDGDDAADITLSGNDTVRHFNIEGGANVTLLSLNLVNGVGSGFSPGSTTNAGGAIVMLSSTLTIRDSRLSNNLSSGLGFGGAIFATSGSTLSLTNVLLDGNAANGGGAINAQDTALTLRNVTVAGNSAAVEAAGVVVHRGFSTTTFDVVNSTFTGNTGGGRAFQASGGATGTIANSVFADGTALADITTSGAFTATGNFVENGSLGTGNINDGGDPLLGPLADNGGTVLTLLPGAGSPLIDAGDNAAVPAGLTLAANGTPRIVGTVDIGAAETSEAPSLVVTTTDDTVDAFDGQTSLREAVAYANSGSAGADPVITFASPLFDTAQTIETNGQLEISHAMRLAGPGAHRLTLRNVAASSISSRIFRVHNGVGPVEISGVNITGGNTNTGSGGGALRVEPFANVTLKAVQITGNTSGILSGGIYCRSSATLTLIDSTISGNFTSDNQSAGGAVFNNGLLTIINSTISGNSAPDGPRNGGGIYNIGGTVAVLNSTIADNDAGTSATRGGGIYNDTTSPSSVGSVTIRNSIIAGNRNSGTTPDISGPVTSQGYNLIGNASGATITGDATGNLLGATAQIGALADNGGPTLTHALLPGSPAIDAGDPAFDPNAFTPPLTTDQRGAGFQRIVGAQLDIGALEASETPSLIVTTTDDVVSSADGLTSLREAIAYANSGSAGASPVITFSDGTGGTVNFHDATPETIALSGSQLQITGSMVIQGPGAKALSVSGENLSRVFFIPPGGSLTVTGLTVTRGTVTPPENGGAFLNRGSLTVRECQVTSSSARGGGAIGTGQLSVSDNATTSVSHSAIIGNSSQLGGAFWSSNFNTTVITNCTISGNSSTPSGAGAIYVTGTYRIYNSTITGNSTTHRGGGIGSDGGSLLLENTLVAGNSAGVGQPDILRVTTTTLTSNGHNLIGNSDTFNPVTWLASDVLNQAPLLGPLADNGGPTSTHALLPGSPAIDAGDPAFDPNAFTPPLTTDQRGSGFDRVVLGGAGPSARIDIGAFEVQTTPAPDIAVFDGTLAGTELMDDTGTVDFGSVERFATSAARVFTIQNTGTAALSGIAVTKGAAGQPDEFALDTTGMSASLLAGESTTFTVTLTPGAFGPRGAVLEIASSDDDENPFEVNLTGTGAPPEFAVVTGQFMLPAEGLVGGGQIYRPLGGVINQDGFVTFSAQGAVGTGGITSGSDNLLLSDASGELRVVAREGSVVQTSPWQTLAGVFSHFLLTEDGQTVALDRIAGAASTSDYTYLASPDGVALEILSREGDAAPSAGTFKLHTAKPAADSLGRVYFSGDLTGAGVTTKTDSGIYQASAGSLVEITREGDDLSALTGDAAWLGGLGVMVAAAGDGAAFTATLQNNPADAKDKTDTARNAVVLAGNESGLELLARKGDVVPDTGGGTMRTFSGVSRGGADSHAFLGLMNTGGGVTTANDQVLVAAQGGSLYLVAREGVTQADGVTLVKFGDFYATGAGEVVFEASGVLCRWTEGGGLEALMRVGAAAPGMGGATITNLARLSVSEGGAIALVTNLSDDRRALWRALPGAALQSVVVTGTTITVGAVLETIYGLDIDGGGAGTGGGGGGMGSAINDVGFVYTTLSLGNGQHVGKVYP